MVLGSLLRKYFYNLSTGALIYFVSTVCSSSVTASAVVQANGTHSSLFPLTPSAVVPTAPTVAPINITSSPSNSAPLFPVASSVAPSAIMPVNVPTMAPIVAPISIAPIPVNTNPTITLPPLFDVKAAVPGTLPPPTSFAPPLPLPTIIVPPAAPVGIAVPIPVSPSTPQPITVALTSPEKEKTDSSAPEPSKTLPPPTPIVVIDPDTVTQGTIHPESKMPKPIAVVEGEEKGPANSALLYENKVISFDPAPPCPVTPPSPSSLPKPEPAPVKKVEPAPVKKEVKAEQPPKPKEKKKGKKKKGKKKKGKKKGGKKKGKKKKK